PFSLTAPFRLYIYTLSLHDALPIYLFKRKCFLLCLYTHAAKIINILKNRQLYKGIGRTDDKTHQIYSASFFFFLNPESKITSQIDRKSTRLNSSHVKISYAVFCLKK